VCSQVDKVIPKVGQPEYRYQLFTDIHFEIKFNEDRVIEVNLHTDPKKAVDISENTKDVKVRVEGVENKGCSRRSEGAGRGARGKAANGKWQPGQKGCC